MKTKKRKILVLATALICATGAVAGVLAATSLSYDSLMSASADNTDLSVTFNSSSTVISGSFKSGSVVARSNLQQSKIGVDMTVDGNSWAANNSDIARLNGTDQSITFAPASNSSGVANFKNIKGLSFTYNSMYNATSYGEPYTYFNVYFAKNSDFSDATVIEVKGSDPLMIYSNILNANYVKITGQNSAKYAYFTSITINYSCSESEGKTLESIAVKSKKTIYAQNGLFEEPVVEGTFSDGSKETIEGATFTGFDLSVLGEQTVTVSYEGKSTSYGIEVRPTETSKKVSYVGYDASTEEETGLSFLDGSSVLPIYAEPAASVTFTPVASGNYVILGAYTGESVEITQSGDSFTFTMPAFDFEIQIVYYLAPQVVDIRVDKPQTVYYTGDSFNAPKVYAVYDNEYEEQINASELSFSGFDSSAVVASQTITVSYQGGEFTAQYTIEVKDASEKPSVITLDGAYQVAQGSNTMSLEFNSDGTGQYVYINAYDVRKYPINFTYSVDSATLGVTITVDPSTTTTNISGYANGYKLVDQKASSSDWINDSGVLNAGHTTLSIRLWRISAGVTSQDATPITFTII